MLDERMINARAVVFDVGNVLLTFEPRLVCGRIPEDRREPLFEAMFGPQGHWCEFDEALNSNEKIARKIAAQAGNEAWWTDVIDAFEHFDGTMRPLPLSESVRELRKMGKRVYALTNYGEPAFTRAYERFPFLRDMDGRVVSARERAVKPDPQIFLTLMERYAVVPEETLFIDDSERNIDAARQLGFMVWHYRTPKAVTEQNTTEQDK